MPDVFSTLEDVDTRVVLDYTNRDFTAIRAQLVGLAKGLMPEWETAGEAPDFGTLLLELFAYMGDVMHFYIDRTASEAFLGTALRRQSVLYIADMLGYTPIGQQAAVVRLLFSLEDDSIPDLTEPLVIPAGTVVHNQADDADNIVKFELNNPVTLDPITDPNDSTRWKDVESYATEGTTVDSQLIGSSQGSPNTEFVIPHRGVVYGSVSIRTTEGAQTVGWNYTSDISLARPTQALFTTFLDDADNTHILFGDNAAGRIPPVNAKIYCTYRHGVGAKANSLPAASVTTLVAPPNVDWWGVSVSNPGSPLGGTDPESTDAMRQSIPRAASRIKSRAITLNDYADLALQVPGVAKSVSHGTVYTAVHVLIAPQKGEGNDEYMDTLCEQVESYMADKVIVGSSVYVEPRPPNAIDQLWQLVWIRVHVFVQDGFNRTSVRSTVDHIIRQVLDFDHVDFGTRISIGSIYRAILSVQGVEWAEVRWLDDADVRDPADVTPTEPERVAFEQEIDVDDDKRQVVNIEPEALKIPKIDDTEIVEAETDWPDLTEDERTHDGLWVKASGGVTGT